MNRLIKFLIISLLLVQGHIALGQETPNVIIILADDLGYGDIACYNDSSKIPTPHVDRLAAGGMRFTDAHTPSSVCTPTRYGLLTGRYAWRTRLKKSVLWPWDPPLIEKNRLTMAEMFQKKGYKTACIGKWHLGWIWYNHDNKPVIPDIAMGQYDAEARLQIGRQVDFSKRIQGGPLAHGFDYYFGDDVPNFPPYAFIENDRVIGTVSVEKPADMFGNPGPAQAGWDLSLVMPRLAQKSVQYIEKRNKNKPFFLYLPLTAPHTPIAPSPHYIGKSQAGWYGDYVLQVDAFVGQIMEVLEREGISENTLLIFTSDNGSPQRDGSNMNGATGSVKAYGHDPSRPWRGMKGDIWEGGHRVPLVARWPEHIPAAKLSDEPMILTDLMRTFAHMLDFRLAKDQAEDSFDMYRVFMGLSNKFRIRPHLVHHSHQGVFAIRVDQWKLILENRSGGFTKYEAPDGAPEGQLYNLEEDPGETKNVYEEYPEMVEGLTRLLERIK